MYGHGPTGTAALSIYQLLPSTLSFCGCNGRTLSAFVKNELRRAIFIPAYKARSGDSNDAKFVAVSSHQEKRKGQEND